MKRVDREDVHKQQATLLFVTQHPNVRENSTKTEQQQQQQQQQRQNCVKYVNAQPPLHPFNKQLQLKAQNLEFSGVDKNKKSKKNAAQVLLQDQQQQNNNTNNNTNNISIKRNKD